MPFKSEAQRKWLEKNKPEVAREFAAATPQGAKLPKRVPSKKAPRRAGLVNPPQTLPKKRAKVSPLDRKSRNKLSGKGSSPLLWRGTP